jgi:F420-non-reducing hydrogenase small subunit
VKDQGSKAFGAIVSLLAARTEGDVDVALESIPDPVGTFYRYGLPASCLGVRVRGGAAGDAARET